MIEKLEKDRKFAKSIGVNDCDYHACIILLHFTDLNLVPKKTAFVCKTYSSTSTLHNTFLRNDLDVMRQCLDGLYIFAQDEVK